VPVFVRLAAVACAETPSHSRVPDNIRVGVRVSFTTGAVQSAFLATAGLFVPIARVQREAYFMFTLVIPYQTGQTSFTRSAYCTRSVCLSNLVCLRTHGQHNYFEGRGYKFASGVRGKYF